MRTKPQLVVCRHIHGGRGRVDVAWDAAQRGHDFGGSLLMIGEDRGCASVVVDVEGCHGQEKVV